MTDPRTVVGWAVEAALLAALLYVLARRVGFGSTVGVTLGSFALRVLVGEGLYFISLLHLPFLDQAQSGSGFWNLAPDAESYDHATRLLLHPTGEIINPIAAHFA